MRPRAPTVLLIRDVPEERRISMDRFADDLASAMALRQDVEVRETTVHRVGLQTPVVGRLDKEWTRFLRYPRALRAQRADVYHIVDHSYADLARVLPFARVVVTCHDLMLLRAEEQDVGFRGRRLTLHRFRWSVSHLHKVAHVVCNSRATQRDAIRLCDVPEARTSVIPPGVGPEFVALPEHERACVRNQFAREQTYAVLHVSTNPYKNVPVTLRVLAALRRGGIDAGLIRVGVMLNRDERRLAHDLGVADAIRDCGFVSDRRLVQMYNASDVLLFPSLWEGFGLPVVEAMACGLPVVTSKADALVELVDGVGLTAPASDVSDLAGAVARLLQSPELAAGARDRGLRHAEKYRAERVAARYAELYARINARADA